MKWIVIGSFISMLTLVNFSFFPNVKAQSQQLFPDKIDKILTANYTIQQQLFHYSKGEYTGSGTINIQFSKCFII